MSIASTSPPAEALGRSEAFLAFNEALSLVAKVDRPVLILGERGTGKELAASRLHFLSPRWSQPLWALNCAALSPTLIESELFGHEAGAFTGATGRQPGRFEAADGGTLFLDELGSIPLNVQEKILRVVEYGSFERVGGTKAVQVDVRIIGATNADLLGLSQEGRFLPDLLDRLTFEVLVLPPLRLRHGDIMLLARHFAARMAAELDLPQPPGFSPQAEDALEAHPWPGNVRELKNVVERAVFRCKGHEITEVDFNPLARLTATARPQAATPAAPQVAPPAASLDPHPPQPPRDFKQAVLELEQRLLKQALESNRHNQAAAARRLGLSYHQMRGLLKKHGGISGF